MVQIDFDLLYLVCCFVEKHFWHPYHINLKNKKMSLEDIFFVFFDLRLLTSSLWVILNALYTLTKLGEI